MKTIKHTPHEPIIEPGVNYELVFDDSSLQPLLDDIAPYIKDMTAEEMGRFRVSAFDAEYTPTVGAEGNTFYAGVWRPKDRYIDLLAAVRAGDITFPELVSTLYREFRGAIPVNIHLSDSVKKHLLLRYPDIEKRG